MKTASKAYNWAEIPSEVVRAVSGSAIYHVGEVGHEVGPGSFLVIPAGAMHYIEPVGKEVVLNIDFFMPPREDYLHLVKYQDEDGNHQSR